MGLTFGLKQEDGSKEELLSMSKEIVSTLTELTFRDKVLWASSGGLYVTEIQDLSKRKSRRPIEVSLNRDFGVVIKVAFAGETTVSTVQVEPTDLTRQLGEFIAEQISRLERQKDLTALDKVLDTMNKMLQ